MLCLLLRHRCLRQQVDQPHIPLTRNAIAIRIGLCKMIARIQEQRRQRRPQLQSQLQQQHILRLKTACKAHIVDSRSIRERLLQLLPHMRHLPIHSRKEDTHLARSLCSTLACRNRLSRFPTACSAPARGTNSTLELPIRSETRLLLSSVTSTSAPAAAKTPGVVGSSSGGLTTNAPASNSARSSALVTAEGAVRRNTTPACPHRLARSNAVSGLASATTLVPPDSTSRTIPAPAVAFVSASISTKAPSVRFSLYRSSAIGRRVSISATPMLFISSPCAGSLRDCSRSTRCRSFTSAGTVWLACFSR